MCGGVKSNPSESRGGERIGAGPRQNVHCAGEQRSGVIGPDTGMGSCSALWETPCHLLGALSQSIPLAHGGEEEEA